MVQIRQLGIDGITTEIRIEKDGTITLHDIGAITVTNKTAIELQEELNALYGKYYRSMRLWIGPCPLNRSYYVGGEVRTPGPKAYLGKTTVTLAIQAAGDFTEFANREKVSLTRPDQEPVRVNVIEALKDPKKDLPVFPDDRIDVPRKWWR